jgi:2-polyprenyl-6-hydroxyphenyl methylase/3-demethylubiquinone-9 3-methyltransferase
VPNVDRISELYRGEIFQRADQVKRQAHERIDWLAAQAHGEVLDVGCSQGIASILCARRGLRVLGVDNEEDRIEYAVRDRSAEPPEVRERIRFEVADARHLELPDSRFDTVLLGEVLEHLDEPAPLLKEVTRLARPDATIAITTPFGYMPHHDHRATFYVTSLIDTLAPHVAIESLDVVDRHFRVVARPGTTGEDERSRLIVDSQPLVERVLMRAQMQAQERGAVVRRQRRRLKRLERRLAAARRKRREAVRELRRSRRFWWRRIPVPRVLSSRR